LALVEKKMANPANTSSLAKCPMMTNGKKWRTPALCQQPSAEPGTNHPCTHLGLYPRRNPLISFLETVKGVTHWSRWAEAMGKLLLNSKENRYNFCHHPMIKSGKLRYKMGLNRCLVPPELGYYGR